jgi:hypothetical protein
LCQQRRRENFADGGKIEDGVGRDRAVLGAIRGAELKNSVLPSIRTATATPLEASSGSIGWTFCATMCSTLVGDWACATD